MDKGYKALANSHTESNIFVPVERVESVLEVHLHDPVVVIKVTSIHASAWTVASAPPLMPNLSCRGARREVSSSLTLLAAIFATRRQRVQLTGESHIFLCRAVRLAPMKEGRMDNGVLPSTTSCTKETSVGGRTWWLVRSESISFKGWDLRPSGPTAELFEKERIACVTFSPEMVRCCEVWSADGMMESGCRGGCFPLKASRVAYRAGQPDSPLETSSLNCLLTAVVIMSD